MGGAGGGLLFIKRTVRKMLSGRAYLYRHHSGVLSYITSGVHVAEAAEDLQAYPMLGWVPAQQARTDVPTKEANGAASGISGTSSKRHAGSQGTAATATTAGTGGTGGITITAGTATAGGVGPAHSLSSAAATPAAALDEIEAAKSSAGAAMVQPGYHTAVAGGNQ